jgi:ribokinase
MAVPDRMTRKRAAIALVGDLFTDHIMTGFREWPRPGEEVFGESYRLEVGGGAAITGCALARLGHKPSLFTSVGLDCTWVCQRLNEFGLIIQGPSAAHEKTGVTFSFSTPEDRTFFTYYGANRYLHSYLESSAAVDELSQHRHIHFALPIPHETAVGLFKTLRELGCIVSLDIGWQTEWFKNVLTKSVLCATDFFFPNEKEACLLTNTFIVDEMLRCFADMNLPRVVIKLGGRGAATLVDGMPVLVAPPEVAVLDTTGAGDAFDAGFIDALVEGSSISDALRRGCISGALSTRALGALDGLPSRDEVLSFL